MQANLVLECEGFRQGQFCFCAGVKNTIMDLESIKYKDNYFDTILYLDKVSNIFNNKCNNYNIITNTIYKMYQLEHIEDDRYKAISYFYKMHERCGLLLYCEPKE